MYSYSPVYCVIVVTILTTPMGRACLHIKYFGPVPTNLNRHLQRYRICMYTYGLYYKGNT